MKRVRYLDNEPYALETAYLNPGADIRVLNIIEKDMGKESLYQILTSEYGIRFSKAIETLEVTRLTKEESKYLSQKKENLQLSEHVTLIQTPINALNM